MWKIAVGFALFAALALYILSKGGDIDMSGENMASKPLPLSKLRSPPPRPVKQNSPVTSAQMPAHRYKPARHA